MKKLLKWSPAAARMVLGIVFFVFGLNGFIHFIPMPTPEGAAAVFFQGLAASGYLLPLLSATETVVGLLLILGRFVPLALTVLAPVMLNIVAYHLFVETEGIGMALVLSVLQLYLAYAYRPAFRGLLEMKAAPASGVHGETKHRDLMPNGVGQPS